MTFQLPRQSDLVGTLQVVRKTRGILGPLNPGQWFGDLHSAAKCSVVAIQQSVCVRLTLNQHGVLVAVSERAAVSSTTCCVTENVALNQLLFLRTPIGTGSFSQVCANHVLVENSCTLITADSPGCR